MLRNLQKVQSSKIQADLNPEPARLRTDRGDDLVPWSIHKGDALRNFEEYYRSQRRAGGQEQEWYRKRMAIVERSLCAQGQPLYKGQRTPCKVVFDVLDKSVRDARLLLPGLVVRFGDDGLPAETVDLEFRFQVSVEVREAGG